MPKIRKDISFVEKYRKKYEEGKITQLQIQCEYKLDRTTLNNYIRANNWNTRLALKNQKLEKKKVLMQKIEKYKNDFEEGRMTKHDIKKLLKCDFAIITEYCKTHNWVQGNKVLPKTIISKVKPTTKVRIGNISYTADNIEVGDIFYTAEGLPLAFQGFEKGTKLVKPVLYTRHTYKNSEIEKIEKELHMKGFVDRTKKIQ